jgi:two-component system sensor histidine kinase UhpB
MSTVSKQYLFKLYAYVIIAAGLAVDLFSIHRLSLAKLDWPFLVLAIITVGIGSRLSVKIPQVRAEVTVADTLIFFAMLLYGGEAAILLAAAHGLVSSLHVSRSSRAFLFNSAQMACSTFLTAWVLHSFFGPIEALHRGNHSARYLAATCIMASVQYIANSGLVALYTSLKNDLPVWNTWRRYYLWTSITYFAGASVASITADVIGVISVYAAIIISPIIAIIYFSYQTYLKNVEASAELRKSEGRYRDLFENAKDALYVHDLHGRYTSVNRAAEKLTGYTRAEILGKEFTDFVPPDQIESIREYFRRKVIDGGETSYESEVVTKDGRRVAVEVNSHMILKNGVPVAIQGAARDITERKAAEEKLKLTSEQLRALSARLQSAREEEGSRIAREIHDELGSALTSLRWDLERIGNIFSESGKRSEVPALQEKIAAMLRLTDTTLNIVRRIASDLRPSVLDDCGLALAIRWQARKFGDRTGIVVHCDFPSGDFDLNQEQSTAVFRIFQEALTNVRRHSHATRVEVTMVEEAGAFLLTIRDNGRGITDDEKSAQLSIGIVGMRERAHLIGGDIDISGVEEGGTAVTVQVPIVRLTANRGRAAQG